MQKLKVSVEDVSKRLDVFLLEKSSDLTRSHIKKLIEKGIVLYNGKPVKSGIKLKINDEIIINDYEMEIPLAKPQDIEIEIIYEDDDLAVINKPQGMVVHAGSGNYDKTLVNALLFKMKNLSGINGVLRPGIVHRLDKNTSGLMLVAKNDAAHVSLSKQISEKTCKRKYLALLEGNLKNECGQIKTNIARDKKNRTLMTICEPSEGRTAITDYKLLQNFKNYSLVEFSLHTGRTHQIRVHASKVLHHAVVGDTEYNKKTNINGQLLHSYSLVFSHPKNEKIMKFEIDLPEYFKNFMNKISK